jgi:hypothetical protein
MAVVYSAPFRVLIPENFGSYFFRRPKCVTLTKQPRAAAYTFAAVRSLPSVLNSATSGDLCNQRRAARRHNHNKKRVRFKGVEEALLFYYDPIFLHASKLTDH